MSYQQPIDHRKLSRSRFAWGAVLGLVLALGLGEGADARNWGYPGRVLARDLAGAGGSTTGPDGAIYVAEGTAGQVTRIDPRTGRKRVVARNLPAGIPAVGIGGPIDVAFIGDELYVLVTLVNEFGGMPDGIYHVVNENEAVLVADIGAFAAANPPPPNFTYELANGLQFAMQAADQGFVVTDGHHNRVLHVTLNGDVSVLKQYGNSVPTGLAPDFATLYVAQLGPVPNYPSDGRVNAFGLLDPDNDRQVASGVPMIVDVEFGPHGDLFALSQGVYDPGTLAGAPAMAKTGKLLKVRDDGTFCTLSSNLDRPTSIDFSGEHGYVVTLTGQVLQYRNLTLISDVFCGWN